MSQDTVGGVVCRGAPFKIVPTSSRSGRRSQASLPYLDLNLIELPALKALTAVGAVDEPFGVCFTAFLIVEKYPGVLSSSPPELPPDLVLLFARAI